MSKKSDNINDAISRGLTSPVWSYFRVCEENPVMADCTLCGVRMSRGGTAPNRCGTTNLRRHILYTHKIDLPSTKPKTTDVSGSKSRNKKALKKSSLDPKKKIVNKNMSEEKRCCSPVEAKEESDPVMCIKWNTYLSNMTTVLPGLLNDEQFVDVTLACEGQSLRCHKILLAACSPYFYDLLSSAACKHPIIMFKDYQFWELQALVAFMYCGEVSVPQSQLPRILRVAEALQIKGLAKPASSSDSHFPSESELPDSVQSDSQETSHSEAEPTNKPCNRVKEGPAAPRDNNKTRRQPPKNCSKSSPMAVKPKVRPKNGTLIRSKAKPKPVKRKIVKCLSKKLKLLPSKKQLPKKPKREDEKETTFKDKNDFQSHHNLPDFLPSELPDMLSDILAMKDSDNISFRGNCEDGMFPLDGLDQVKMDIDDDVVGIGPVVINGLHHQDHFDLLPHISPDCKLD